MPTADLARALLAHPRMAEQPAEVVRGMVLVRAGWVHRYSVGGLTSDGWWDVNNEHDSTEALPGPDGLDEWTLDLTSPATAGVLLAMLQREEPGLSWCLCWGPDLGWFVSTTDYEGNPIDYFCAHPAEACAKALAVAWGVPHGE